MTSKYARLISMLLLSVLVVSGLYAQSSTTGSITGTVRDSSSPLPGVTVELKSPKIQGTKTEITDSRGEFRFSLLNPGVYTLSTNLSGFSSARTENIQVGLGRTVTLDVRMSAQLTEQITVSGAAPVVDVTSASTGANVTSQMIESLPLQRDFYAVAQLAPGTGTDTNGTTIYGSTSAENQYIIDGLNTTGVETGIEGKTLNFDFIQEVEVLTGGLPAEYGRLTGGVINAITKSGGNEFSGDVFGYSSPDGPRSPRSNTFSDRAPDTASVSYFTDENDIGFDLGGYLLKDRLWFFGAYDKIKEDRRSERLLALAIPGGNTFPAGATFPTTIDRENYAAKLTFRLSDAHSLAGSVFADPQEIDGALVAIAGPPSTYLGLRETGGNDYNLRYQGVFGGSFITNAMVGTHHEEDFTSGEGTKIQSLIDRTMPCAPPRLPTDFCSRAPALTQGGIGFFQNQVFDRDVIKGDFTKFLGRHEFKVGADFEKNSAVNQNFNSGNGDRVQRRAITASTNPRRGQAFFQHRFYLDDSVPGFDKNNPATWRIAYPLQSEPKSENTSAYIQDGWKVLPNLTLNLGFRWEKQDVIGRNDVKAFTLDDNYAPRLGLIWDVLNNGRSKFYANYGRYYESIPLDINIRAFGGEITVFSRNFSPTDFRPDPAVNLGFGAGGFLALGGKTPVDPNLKGQYVDEVIAGFEYEVAPNLALGVKGTYRDLGQVIEDLLTPNGEYNITNPGKGLGRQSVYYYTNADGEHTKFAPAAEAIRKYTGVELSARKRFSNGYQFLTSYLWSQLEGNYDGVFQVSTGQLDPNINSAYDYADFSINNSKSGPLSNDREHQLKFDGSYTFSRSMLDGLTVGLSAHYASGTPLTAFGYSQAYQNFEYFLTPRGKLGTGPDEYEADFHLGYPIKFGSTSLNLLLDVFNLLDRQQITTLDQRYNLVGDGACAGVPAALCNDDGGLIPIEGTTKPAGTIPNPRATATNPGFLKAGSAFSPAREVRLGARFRF